MQPDIQQTLAERGNRYGDFSDHAVIAQDLQDVMRRATRRDGDSNSIGGERLWERLSPDKKQALTVIADKIARILSGDPEYTDNWHDIQGYAKLAEDRCLTQDQLDAANNQLAQACDQLLVPHTYPSAGASRSDRAADLDGSASTTTFGTEYEFKGTRVRPDFAERLKA